MNDEKKSKKRLIEELEHQRERTAHLERLLLEMEQSDSTLAERKLRYRILSELTSDCCWVRWTRPDGSTRRLWVTDSFERVTGYSPEEFEAMGREKLVHPDDFEKIQDFIDGPFGVSQHEFRIIRKDGETRHLRERMRVVTEGDSICIYGATWDITEEKQALEALRRSEERTRLIIETALDGVLTMDENGQIFDWNPQAGAMFGWTREQALNKNLADLIDATDLEAAFEKPLGQVLTDRDDRFFLTRLECRGIHRSGRIFPLEMSVIPLNHGGGGLLSAFVRDLSVVKEAEKQKKTMEAQMLHVQKLESLGVVAAGIAHDFNNLLTIIMGNVEMVQRLVADQPHLAARHATALDAASRASQLCRQLLAYAGKEDFEFTALNLNHVIEDMQELLHVCVSKTVALDVSLAPTLPLIDGGADPLRQAVLNLVTNASEALIDGEGTISVSTRVAHCDAQVFSRCYLNDPLPEGQYVVLEVRDSGTGIRPDVQKKMFDPFFSTKFIGRGLGLATVLGIVRSHGGAIEVQSQSGNGAMFRVYLPAFQGNILKRQGLNPPADFDSQGETILVIDDDVDVRDMCYELLDDCGYRVVLAESGEEGLDLIGTRQNIDLVLLDLNMPGTSGMETLHRIKKERPRIPVILMSGYADEDPSALAQTESKVTFIQKPFRRDPFLKHVAASLER